MSSGPDASDNSHDKQDGESLRRPPSANDEKSGSPPPIMRTNAFARRSRIFGLIVIFGPLTGIVAIVPGDHRSRSNREKFFSERQWYSDNRDCSGLKQFHMVSISLTDDCR